MVLLLDYGYPAEELYARPYGTLLTYYRHTLGANPFERVGRQDLSAHVDFSTVARAALRSGLDVLGLIEQRHLLRNLGFPAFLSQLAAETDRAAVQRLLDPTGLGKVKALFLTRDLPGWPPAGLSGGRVWPPPSQVPTLPPGEDDQAFLDQWREAFGEEP
jgi:SAM-dependent MidA family methyltransferase